jgi:anti-sigma B factor antagonist
MTPTPFSTSVSVDGGVHVVAVRGELDAATAPELKQTLEGDCGAADALLIDLDRCEFVDSTGLAVLVAASTRIEERGGSFAICCATSQVARLFEITGAASGLGLAADRSAGLAAVSGGTAS